MRRHFLSTMDKFHGSLLTFGLVLEAVGLLVPFVWVFALPMGILTATLLIFGRFSADQELTAVRASGISLLTLVTPVLLLSLLLCGVSAAVNMEFGPRCRVAYTQMLAGLKIDLTAAQLRRRGDLSRIPRASNTGIPSCIKGSRRIPGARPGPWVSVLALGFSLGLMAEGFTEMMGM